MSELVAIAEIPQNEHTEILVRQAAELLFREVNQKEMGDSPDDLVAQKISLDDVKHRRLFVGVDKTGDVVAAAGLTRSSEPTVDRIAVEPEYRREHIGGQLLSAVEGAAKEDGANQLILYPTDSSIPFYTAQGFEVVADEDGSHLAKTLK